MRGLSVLRLAVLLSPVFLTLLTIVTLQAVGVLKGVPFAYNARNLLLRWRTTLLTALAFTLVVGLMTVLLAFVNGMYKLTESSGIPGNIVVLSDGALDEAFSNLGYGDIDKMEFFDPRILKDANGKTMWSREVYVVVNQPILRRRCAVCQEMVPVDRYGEKLLPHGEPTCEGSGATVTGRGRRFLQVRGIVDAVMAGRVHNVALYEGGTWFSEAGVEPLPESTSGEMAIQCVIGEGLARELAKDLGKDTLVVGDVFELGPRKWIIVGIMRSAGSMFDSEVWAKFQQISEQFGKRTYTTIVLRTADADTARELATYLNKEFKTPAVSATPETEYYERLNTTNQQFLGAIIIVVCIMAAGSVFGVMNTMFAAIAQRTKDIGVLRILGFAPWQVLVSFFLEAVLLAVVGGALGCALGSLVHGMSASSIASSGQGGGGKTVVLKLVVDAKIIGAGMTFSLLMGCMGGFFPAISAMRLKPLDAVR